jgi:hypothetical protein
MVSRKPALSEAEGDLRLFFDQTRALVKRLNLRLNLRQSSFKRRPPRRTRSPLRKNILPLQHKSLFLPLFDGANFIGGAPLIFTHEATGCLSFLRSICHLFLHRFTFPSASHIFILRGFGRIASLRMDLASCEVGGIKDACLADRGVWH